MALNRYTNKEDLSNYKAKVNILCEEIKESLKINLDELKDSYLLYAKQSYAQLFGQVTSSYQNPMIIWRILRSFRVYLVHKINQKLLKDICHLATSVQLLDQTNNLRSIASIIPQTDTPFIYGTTCHKEYVSFLAPPNSYRTTSNIQPMSNKFLNNGNLYNLYSIPSTKDCLSYNALPKLNYDSNKIADLSFIKDPEHTIKEQIKEILSIEADCTSMRYALTYKTKHLHYDYDTEACLALNAIALLNRILLIDVYGNIIVCPSYDWINIREIITSGRVLIDELDQSFKTDQTDSMLIGCLKNIISNKKIKRCLIENLRSINFRLLDIKSSLQVLTESSKLDKNALIIRYLRGQYTLRHFGIFYAYDRMLVDAYNNRDSGSIADLTETKKRFQMQKVSLFYDNSYYLIPAANAKSWSKEEEDDYFDCTYNSITTSASCDPPYLNALCSFKEKTTKYDNSMEYSGILDTLVLLNEDERTKISMHICGIEIYIKDFIKVLERKKLKRKAKMQKVHVQLSIEDKTIDELKKMTKFLKTILKSNNCLFNACSWEVQHTVPVSPIAFKKIKEDFFHKNFWKLCKTRNHLYSLYSSNLSKNKSSQATKQITELNIDSMKTSSKNSHFHLYIQSLSQV